MFSEMQFKEIGNVFGRNHTVIKVKNIRRKKEVLE
jgi:hypothetical protein